eukprot:TRINITY_DN5688_c0_g1_i1.p1 TRINITY_DN5688_c0_g1~~TRINITY_DN5688_c0_g1_i1.p1  ORF type:complete len:163 (-),score=41.27 TRINITY_DN5688_c0_g1_i1:517-1005(-)
MADSSYEDPALAEIGAQVAEKAKTFGDGLDPSLLPDAATQPAYNSEDVQEVAAYGESSPSTDETVAELGSDFQTKAVVSEGYDTESTPPTTEFSEATPTTEYTADAVASVDSEQTSLAEIGEQVAEKAKKFGDGLDASVLPDEATQPDYNAEEVKDALTPEY